MRKTITPAPVQKFILKLPESKPSLKQTIINIVLDIAFSFVVVIFIIYLFI